MYSSVRQVVQFLYIPLQTTPSVGRRCLFWGCLKRYSKKSVCRTGTYGCKNENWFFVRSNQDDRDVRDEKLLPDGKDGEKKEQNRLEGGKGGARKRRDCFAYAKQGDGTEKEKGLFVGVGTCPLFFER